MLKTRLQMVKKLKCKLEKDRNRNTWLLLYIYDISHTRQLQLKFKSCPEKGIHQVIGMQIVIVYMAADVQVAAQILVGFWGNQGSRI